MRAQLGNSAPHEVLTTDDAKRRGLKPSDYDKYDTGKVIVPIDTSDAVTTLAIPDDRSIGEAFLEVTHLWGYHSSEPPGWVASDSAGLAALLAEQYGCEARELADGEG